MIKYSEIIHNLIKFYRNMDYRIWIYRIFFVTLRAKQNRISNKTP